MPRCPRSALRLAHCASWTAFSSDGSYASTRWQPPPERRPGLVQAATKLHDGGETRSGRYAATRRFP
jgi:hypothetical protein